jgi:hypothetical protein
MGQEDTLSDNNISKAEEVKTAPESEWCCMYCVLLLQEDFATEKLMIQHYIESCGHVCMFLPKFHCELNPIELLWGYAKYYEFYCCFPLYSYHANLNTQTIQVIAKCPMENSQPQKSWFHSVLIYVRP